MDSGPTDEDFTMISVYLARIITSDGRMEMVMKMPRVYSSVELLGLLELGKLHVIKEILGRDGSRHGQDLFTYSQVSSCLSMYI